MAFVGNFEDENKLQSKEFSVIGAQYLILGSVSEYGRSSESDVGIFSRNKIQKANVTVNVRLVDTKTSRVVFSEEATGEARVEAPGGPYACSDGCRAALIVHGDSGGGYGVGT